MDEFLKEISLGDTVPTLLLHSCCAPCSSYVIEYLSPYFEICVLYYNPNIYPEEEYLFRKAQQKSFITVFPSLNRVSFIDCEYDKGVFYERVSGYENEPERGARCTLCFELRLKKAAEVAKQAGYDYFATTLTISPHKNAELINEVGQKCADETGAIYLPSNFKKKGGYLRSTQLSNEYGMYRQDYCGCEFSAKAHREPGHYQVSPGL